MTIVALAAWAAVVALPHRLRLAAVEPASAATLWVANLTLRALSGVLIAVSLVVLVPANQVFSNLTHWCWHTIVPPAATHLGLNGHRLGDAAIVFPSVVLALSLLWVGVGVLRVARAVRRLLRRAALGPGPQDSVIVGGPGIVLAAAGLTRPQVIVSAGALAQLDDEELAAGLAHERGHIVRRHRWILVYAELCRALAVFLPGTRAAVAHLSLHLERDADRWALSRRNDRLALASAIVKAAASLPRPSTALAALGGPADQLTQRLEDLVGSGGRDRHGPRRAARVVALASCVAAFALTAAVPATLAAAPPLPPGAGERHCT